jgi:signal transduction histidine kinase
MAVPPEQDPSQQPEDAGDSAARPERTPENTRPPHPPSARNGHGPHAHPPHPPHPPALRRTVIRPASSSPEPVDAAFVANRLTTLTHELSSLLDASLRIIGQAKRSVAAEDRAAAFGNRKDACPEQLARQLDTVDAAMRQMAELVRSTMIGMSENGAAGIRSSPTFGSSSSLADAVRHAVDVMTPFAEEHCVQMDTQISPDLAEIAAGPIYAVITNGVRNAVESIHRIGHQYVGGRVLVRCWTEAGKTGRCVMITIEDDGEGLPHPPRKRRPRTGDHEPFALGFSTKPGGSGIGLSLSRDVIEQLGGTIDLHAKPRDPHSGRAGAVLKVCYPVPKLRMAG